MVSIKSISSALFVAFVMASCSSASPDRQLAEKIVNDSTLQIVDSMARTTLRGSFNAGSGYSQVWARDLNTFIETACEVNDPSDIRQALLLFFMLQQPNGEMIDGYVLREDFTWNDPVAYYSDAAPAHVGFKNTVETDQETSLIQALCKYVAKTGDTSIFAEEIAGRSVSERIDDMISYLLAERFDPEHQLLYGAFTADWGDVQPDGNDPVDMNENSTRTIDAYDNAMLIIALDMLLEANPDNPKAADYRSLRDETARRTRQYLWDDEKNKIIPHIYLDKSPLPADFDESLVHYHGGTAIAIEAGLLEPDEIAAVNNQMLENVRLSGMPSIGLTVYPTYPEGFFPGGMATPYVYQNGGDWTWFGGRMIQQLIANGMIAEAYDELRPMIDRVITNGGFYEWYGQGGVPSGSGHFKGSAGVLAKAIAMLNEWARENGATPGK